MADQRSRRALVGAGAVGVAGVVAAAVVAAASLSSDDGQAVDLPRSEQPYAGPLYVENGRYGAAGPVLDCRFPPADGAFHRGEVYGEGATSDGVAEALDTARSEGLFLDVPDLNLEIARTEPDRVLLTYATGGAVKVALIFRDGPGTEGAGGDGWYLESWARCDLAEFPADVAESYFGYQLWTDADGLPAPTTQVVSFPGSAHCDWQRTTFLSLREGRDEVLYARDPQPELVEYMQGRYIDDMRLPDDAVATTFSRDGRRLWLSADQRYVYVGRPGSVEAWPRTEPGFGCA